MNNPDTIGINVNQIISEVINDAQELYEEKEIAYDSAVEAVESFLDEHTYSITDQVFIIETLLANQGLDKETYLYHTLEDTGYNTDSTTVIQQLYENALTAVVLQREFDQAVGKVDTTEEQPSEELTIDPESVLENLEEEAGDRQNSGDSTFDAVYDTIDSNWDELKSKSLTEQAAILDHLATKYGIESATPSEQLEDSTNESTDLVIGSLLWHNLQEYLRKCLTESDE